MALISSWKLALDSWSVTVPNPSLPVVTKTLVACQGPPGGFGTFASLLKLYWNVCGVADFLVFLWGGDF